MDEILKRVKQQYGENTTILKPNEEFKFTCTACGECCKDRTGANSIILSPYDMFNLQKNLNVKLRELLDKHVTISIGSNSGLPIAYLRSKTSLVTGETLCTFLKKQDGAYRCSVHQFKPVVCSLYPLGRLTAFDKNSNERILHYLYLGGDCSNENKENIHNNTIDKWVKNREITERVFIDFSIEVSNLLKIINLQNFFDSEKISINTKQGLQASLIALLYGNYDTDKDFLPQFESNMEELKDVLKLTVSLFHIQDKSIVSDFKDFYDFDEIKNYILNSL